MQIFWVSGPVGKIHRINLRLKHLLIGICSVALSLILLGIFLQFMGFQMAIEYNPQLARKLGNVHTAMELENLTTFYRQKLANIEKQVASYEQKIGDLEGSNHKLAALATPLVIKNNKPRPSSSGGPFIAPTHSEAHSSLMSALQESQRDLKHNNQYLDDLSNYWLSVISWLETKPTGVPIEGQVSISSGFGKRLDPFNHSWGQHLGLDFYAVAGTGVFSSGAGHVKTLTRDPEYGNLLVLNHGSGLESRYAHLSEFLVSKGQSIQRGQMIAKVGSTGRATGPHLHFEVLKDGKHIDPSNMLMRQLAQE